MNHSRWQTARERALRGEVEPPHITAEREQIRLAMALGQLVYDRRAELGLSEDALATRLGATADDVEAIELGGVVPVTAELLLTLATALEVAVDLHLTPSGTAISFAAIAA
ncbi:MAG: helix-turn-helix domain-containing protein [Streptomycetaceae bacterium]|nr:helix-turn-helix domain-containing protein [Streptomycetaceae bacterium]